MTVTLRGRPVPDRDVRVRPAAGQACAPQMVRTDRNGRAWFVLPLAGNYRVAFADLASTTVNVPWAKREKKAGYAFIQHQELTLPANAPAELTQPLNRPDTDRKRFLELVAKANPHPKSLPTITTRPASKEPRLMPTVPTVGGSQKKRFPPLTVRRGKVDSGRGRPLEGPNGCLLTMLRLAARRDNGVEDHPNGDCRIGRCIR